MSNLADKLIENNELGTGKSVYIVLTDTNSRFQQIARRITKQPYNHVSVSFTDDFTEMYSYSIYTTYSGLKGGIVKEEKEEMEGSKYSMYEIKLPLELFEKIKERVDELTNNKYDTEYDILGLFNAIFNVDFFKGDDPYKMICSHFVDHLFAMVGIKLLKNKSGNRIKPYDLVKSKLLIFVRRGKIK